MNKITLSLTSLLFSIALSNVFAQEWKVGVIDKTGNFVVFPQYDYISNFHGGVASFEKDGKLGFIDKTGKVVVHLQYDQVDIWGRKDEYFFVTLGGKYGIIDKTGKEIIPPKYDRIQSSFNKGIAWVELGYKYGIVDETGKEIIPPKYDDISDFNEGLARVHNGWGNGEKYGFIDKIGNEVVPLQYENAFEFSEGLALVSTGKGWGFIDKTGKMVIPPIYSGASISFREGLAKVCLEKTNSKYGSHAEFGFIDKTGKEVIPIQYDWTSSFREGLAIVRSGGNHVSLAYIIGGKCGAIDKTGKEIIPPKYDHISDFNEGFAIVRSGGKYSGDMYDGGKYGVIDKTGKEIVSPKYDHISDFNEGLAVVQIRGKYGSIDETGKEVILPIYDGVAFAKEGMVLVQLGDMCGYVDKTGKEIVPFKFGILSRGFSEGLAVVYVNSEEFALFEKNHKRVQQTWAECKNKLHNCPYNTGEIQFDSALSISFFLNPRLDSITDSIVSEIKRKTSELMDYCLLFENNNNKIQNTWKEYNKQLKNYPYNIKGLQLDPISITNYFMHPRLETIADSIIGELIQKSSELQFECYNNLKANQPKVFSGIFLEQHPEAKSVLENLKLECRCNNYSEAELVVRIADNAIPECTCRNDYWNQYGNLFSSRDEFDNTYNTSEQEFLNDVNLRQSLKADIQEIASMLSGLNKPKFKDGLTGKNENIIQILQKVQYHKRKYYYDEVVEMMFAADASMTKEWEKKGSLFSSRNEFYEAYVSGDYKNVLKEKKSK